MSTPRFLGITDEVTACDCCGKSNLKLTVAISLDGESDPVYFGSTCAARALKGRGYDLKGSQVLNRAQDVQFTRDQLTRTLADLARMEAMQAAGHARYVIGGVARGAELSYLIDSRSRDVAQLEAKLKTLEVL